MDSERFLKLRENALKSLEKAIQDNRVDEDIIEILDLINKSGNIFTTSSCSGRIVIIEVPYPGAKPGARFLGKWHRKVEEREVYEAIGKAEKGYILFMVHPPIIHAVTKDPFSAERLVKLGLSSGFKNSGLRAFRGKIVVELRSTERMDVLIGKNGELFVNERYISLLCEFANLMLEKAKEKLDMLKKNLQRGKHLINSKTNS